MNRWDVYWADVPFEEDALRGKRRPVVIASDRTVYVLVLRVTSHAARLDDPYDYALQEWRFAGLTKESVVRVRKIAQLRPEAIGEYIGRLHPVDILAYRRACSAFSRSGRSALDDFFSIKRERRLHGIS